MNQVNQIVVEPVETAVCRANSLDHERRERARDRRLRLVSRVRLSELSLPVKKNVSSVLFFTIQYLA